MTTNSFIARGGQLLKLSSMFSLKTSADSPVYLVLTGLDRNEYTAGATGETGMLIGNGTSDAFSSIGGDGRGVGVVFTLQASSGRYYNNTYGYFDKMSYQVSASLNDVTNLSLYTTNDHSLAANYGSNAYAMAQLDAAGYLGSATVVTQPAFAGTVPQQATPESVAAAAQSFVGKAWNMNGCWVLASTIAADAGASLPVDSSMVGVSGQANGEWFVAFDGSKQSGNWQAMVKAGEIIVIGSAATGHVTTCVGGSGSTAMLIDNVSYVNATGKIQNAAGDGASNDVVIAAAHLAGQEWNGVQTGMVKIYELDTPTVTGLVALDKVAINTKQALAPLFSAADPAGKLITEYQLYNTAASNSLIVNGAATAAHSAAAAVTVGSLAAVSLMAGAAVGSDTISVRAYNGSYWGDWQTLPVSVGSAAAAPVVSETAAQTWSHGQHVSFTLPSNTFTDPNGQKLNYSATLLNGAALPAWLTFQAASKTFSGIVPAAAASFGLKVTATDTSGLSASETIAITVAAAAPVLIHQTPNQAWLGGQKVALAIPAATFGDPQGQHLALSAYQIGGNSAASWLSFNASTGTFSGLVPKTASGAIELEVTATNSSGLSTNDVFYASLGTSASLVGQAQSTHGMELVHMTG